MSKIDVITQCCIYNDYHLYRKMLKKYRNKFNKIILYASRHHGVLDLENHLRETIPETWVSTEIDWTTPGIDWRQVETEPCLEESDAEWILFLEQDFFCDDWNKLWVDVEEAMKTVDMITKDAQELGAKIVKLQDLGWTDPEHAFHL